MLASFVDEPARVTPAQMDRWCRDFDNWAICDTVCFHLFDRTPHAWAKVAQWSRRGATSSSSARRSRCWRAWPCTTRPPPTSRSSRGLPLIERAADDERNFVKKAVNWALRAIGKRNPALNAAAVTVARRLADLDQAAPRWVGKDALRELTSPAVQRARVADATQEAAQGEQADGLLALVPHLVDQVLGLLQAQPGGRTDA